MRLSYVTVVQLKSFEWNKILIPRFSPIKKNEDFYSPRLILRTLYS